MRHEGTAASRAQVEDLIEAVSRIARDLKDTREEMRRLGEKLDERGAADDDAPPEWVRPLLAQGSELLEAGKMFVAGDKQVKAALRQKALSFLGVKAAAAANDDD